MYVVHYVYVMYVVHLIICHLTFDIVHLTFGVCHLIMCMLICLDMVRSLGELARSLRLSSVSAREAR